MTGSSLVALAGVTGALALTAPPLGRYLAAVFGDGAAPGDRFFDKAERAIFRLIGVDPHRSQRWTGYALSIVTFGLASVLVLYAILRTQASLPFNPTGAPGMPPALAFNTAVSFVTGTNWQAYAGENSASHLAQMTGLVVAHFTAAAVGMGVALALIRSLAARVPTVGNFWADAVRFILRVMLPMAAVASLVLVAQGAVQDLRGSVEVTTVEGATQAIPGGPVATQEATKTLGTTGGGLYNAGSAHPFANPTGFTGLFQLYLALILPFALPFAYGAMVRDRAQGRALVVVMGVLFLGATMVGMTAEGQGNPRLEGSGASQEQIDGPSGNLEGKEVRFGAEQSALATIGTMGTSAGITTSGLDSYTPIGGASALIPILGGEVSPGGVGTGLTGMLVYALLAVFIAGQMIGRTPEYLGLKLGAVEMKLAALYLVAVPTVILACTGATVLRGTALSSRLNDGAHGFTEISYAFASATNGNGSAFAGLSSNTDWYNTTLGAAMLVGRYVPILIVLALAGAFGSARIHARSRGTLRTTSPTFLGLLLGIIVVVGGLTYLPALVLGPISEALTL